MKPSAGPTAEEAEAPRISLKGWPRESGLTPALSIGVSSRFPSPPVHRTRGSPAGRGALARLKGLSAEVRSAVVQVAEEFQNWAFCVRVCAESIAEASRQVERSASLARLA